MPTSSHTASQHGGKGSKNAVKMLVKARVPCVAECSTGQHTSRAAESVTEVLASYALPWQGQWPLPSGYHIPAWFTYYVMISKLLCEAWLGPGTSSDQMLLPESLQCFPFSWQTVLYCQHNSFLCISLPLPPSLCLSQKY